MPLDIPAEDGVYIYTGNHYERIYPNGPFVPQRDGVYMIYFRNRECPGCKAFDRLWSFFAENFKRDFGTLAVVQCKNFFYDCYSQDAADTFIFYLVLATPQVVVVIVENGIPIYIEREMLFESLKDLEDFVYGVHERRKLAEEKTEQEEEVEGLYIDFSKRNWKEVVKQLKELIFEGKNIRELCNEKGCKIVIE
jgi:thiol-disulfide isomerase/thioredoxin|uniref:Thioredoxin n=1 Tax=Ignisphaera aggregans TaxID=334771 RepID=A0A7J2U4B8_9CREN